MAGVHGAITALVISVKKFVKGFARPQISQSVQELTLKVFRIKWRHVLQKNAQVTAN